MNQLEQEDDQRRRNELDAELALVNQELEMYYTASYEMFDKRLHEMEDRDLEILIGAPLEELDKVRERIKVVRQIFQFKPDLERQKAEIMQELGLEEEV